MRAIILAAGAGTRLSPLTDHCPKCLVPVDERKLIDYQLQALRAAGVDDFAIVVGYEAEQVRAHCGDGVRYIDNPDYLSTNSIYSLYLAIGELNTDTFLFNCDILFHPQVLTRMLESGHPNVVAVDSGVELEAGEMNVRCDGEGRVEEISKQLDPTRAHAQSIQLVKFDAEGAARVGEDVERLVAEERKDVFPTSAYGPLIERESLYAVEVGDLPWGEIDSLADYDRAVDRVLPLLP